MSVTITDLRDLLGSKNLIGFIEAFDKLELGSGAIELTILTQRILPGLLLEQLLADGIPARHIVLLWRLVRTGRLILVENALLEAINERLDAAWKDVHGSNTEPPQQLATFPPPGERSSTPPVVATRETPSGGDTLPMQRIVLKSVFSFGPVQLSDALTHKKNLCLSSQEREFLKAIRQYFPALRAYPNIPVRNFMDLEGLAGQISDRHQRYARSAQVDVLLCTEDEDPVAGVELDSAMHDTDDARARDELKNDLFRLTGIPLVRIRAEDTTNIRAEEFYDLLCAQADCLDKLRPRRLRPRRTHDMLLPVGTDVRRFSSRSAG